MKDERGDTNSTSEVESGKAGQVYEYLENGSPHGKVVVEVEA